MRPVRSVRSPVGADDSGRLRRGPARATTRAQAVRHDGLPGRTVKYVHWLHTLPVCAPLAGGV